MEYIIGFSQFGVNLTGQSRQELLQDYVNKMGGPQNLFNLFIERMSIIPDISKEAEIVETKSEEIQKITE